ncbi:MAG: hypothetical protein OXC82_02325 [Rhodobacteraceae bacterium]|nr:hypothetical protein [Paracoccaceae bacterium]
MTASRPVRLCVACPGGRIAGLFTSVLTRPHSGSVMLMSRSCPASPPGLSVVLVMVAGRGPFPDGAGACHKSSWDRSRVSAWTCWPAYITSTLGHVTSASDKIA